MNSELEQKSTEELIELALAEKDEHIISQYISGEFVLPGIMAVPTR